MKVEPQLLERGEVDSRPISEPHLGSATIVIPVRDRIEITRACLAALRREQLKHAEVVVVDDGSGDQCAGDLGAYANELRVVRHPHSRGYAAACNSGAKTSTADYIVLLNNDTLPIDGWLDALRRYAAAAPRAAIIGARLLLPDRSVQHAGVVVAADGFLHHLYRGFPGDHPAPGRSRRIRMVTGAAMLVRRSVWETLGGFDPAFANGYEDVDLCLRAEALGHEVHVCGDAVLYHLESATRTQLPAGENANYQRFTQRWGPQPPDELDHYVADGLVRASHHGEDVCITVDPVLGRPAAATPTGLEALLDRRANECFELRRENSMLRASLEDPWLRGAEPVRGPSDALELSIVIALAEEHGDDSIPAILEALRAQSYPTERFEVLVSNSAGGISAATAAALAAPRGLRLRALDVSVPGRAAANNRGIAEARGDLVLLLGDDFIPGPDLVAHHAALHAEDPRPETVGIGPGRMSEELRREPFARWIEDSGELFGVSFTTRAGEIPEYFFYGANTSCKRAFMLAAGPLNEAFDGVAWDDYEYGRRLVARGMRARFVAGALARHDHALGLAERRGQMRRAGAAAVAYDGMYPAGHPWHSGVADEPMPGLLRTGWTHSRALVRRRDADRGAYFQLTLRRAFLKGYRAAAASARRDGPPVTP